MLLSFFLFFTGGKDAVKLKGPSEKVMEWKEKEEALSAEVWKEK